MTATKYSKDELKTLLKDKIALVVFEKADGSIRNMRCTLRSEYLPPAKQIDESAPAKTPRKPSDAIAVWDLENQGWRSFHITQIIKEVVFEDDIQEL